MPKQIHYDYVCPRCLHTTVQRNDMRRHFKRKLPCRNETNLILTEKIKEIVLRDHKYHTDTDTDTEAVQIEQTINNNHTYHVTTAIQTATATEIPKRKSIPKKLRTQVWNTYIGQRIGVAPCWCCKVTEISQSYFECGRVIACSKGGTISIDNLRPICTPCRLSMQTENMLDFQKTLVVAQTASESSTSVATNVVDTVDYMKLWSFTGY